jgi:hypothetical protein
MKTKRWYEKEKEKRKMRGATVVTFGQNGFTMCSMVQGTGIQTWLCAVLPNGNGTDFAVSFCPRDYCKDCAVLSSGQSWYRKTEEIGCLNGHVAAATKCRS